MSGGRQPLQIVVDCCALGCCQPAASSQLASQPVWQLTDTHRTVSTLTRCQSAHSHPPHPTVCLQSAHRTLLSCRGDSSLPPLSLVERVSIQRVSVLWLLPEPCLGLEDACLRKKGGFDDINYDNLTILLRSQRGIIFHELLNS